MSATVPGADRAVLSRAAWWLGVLLLLLIAFRVGYHYRYLTLSPFAQVTLSDGQVYEDAARDILAHPPWGSQPFFLQGLYAYVLAIGMAIAPVPFAGLLVQLALSALGLWAVYRALRGVFDVAPARAAMALLLAYPPLWFYENKYLSAGVGLAASGAALLAFVRLLRLGRARDALLLGVALALSVLGRPNMLLALPFALLGVLVAFGSKPRPTSQLLLALALGTALGLLPMAARNALVTGQAQVLPSHGGGIPFFIGNNAHADGLWNSGGGLLTGQVAFERAELQQKLGLSRLQGPALDRAIGDALYVRALLDVRRDPGRAARLLVRKLALTFGNAEHAHDYDRLGEAELLGLLGAAWLLGVPFGLLLALGTLGMVLLASPTSADDALGARADLATRRALSLFLLGQVVAVTAANVVYFHASQHRLPLSLPLAFASAAVFAQLIARGGAARLRQRHTAACALALLLGVQAFLPREPSPPRAVTASHHANLAAAFEVLGQHERAVAAYRTAVAKSPKHAMLRFRAGLALARIGRTDEAIASLERAHALAGADDPLIRDASARELSRLRGTRTRP